MLYVVHLKETDGDIHFERLFTIDEVNEYIKLNNLVQGDYTVVQGDIINLGDLK